MRDALSLLTINWLLPRILLGVLIGYALRVIEHFIWASRAQPDQNPLGKFGFSLMILPQCAVIGVSVGYLFLALVASYFKDVNVVSISAFLLPGLMSFLAVDLREVLRRISRI